MSTAATATAAAAPNPLTLHDLAIQAATNANLNSFTKAYKPDPDQASRISTTLSKTCTSLTRLLNIYDTGLTKQVGFFKSTNNALTVLSCPHPATHPITNENVLAGSLGDALNIICPVTITMRDVKGHVISIAKSKALATATFNLPTSTSEPLNETGPAPDDGTEAEDAGPDRIFIEVTDPNDTPCFAMFPKVFPFPGGYSIPPIVSASADPPPPVDTPAPTNPAFDMWNAAMMYGITNLQDKSIHDHDTLFDYGKLDTATFAASDRDLVPTFTTVVTYLTPDDPLYQSVAKYALAAKERAIVAFGSQSTPPSTPQRNPSPTDTTAIAPATSPTSVSDMTVLIEGLSKAITNSKSLTTSDRDRATEAEEVISFYQILLASIQEVIQSDGTTKSALVKAELNPLFIKVLQANKNSKATKCMQDLIEDTTAALGTQDNNFAAACNIIPRMFDQPLVAALRSGTWEHQHTVLHPDGIKTHFGLHHIASPRTWSVLYKARMEGEMMLVRQEQVEEDKSRLHAKATELYHMGKMGSLADINELLGNFYGLINAIATFDATTPPAIWLEILAFEKIFRTLDGRQWFELHRNLREVPFNVVQDIQSTLAGFVTEARKSGYRSAVTTGVTISPQIFHQARQQGIEIRRTLQRTVLTMSAGHYNLVPLIYKFFHPEHLSTKESPKKRDASSAAGDSSHPTSRPRLAPPPASSGTARTHPNTPAVSPGTQATPGKTILKILGEQNIKLPHPGPIFPHPTKTGQFTLMCCRSAFEGKQCPVNPCNFYHFPTTLAAVPAQAKAKLQKWVAEQDNLTWTSAATSWGTSASTSTAGN